MKEMNDPWTNLPGEISARGQQLLWMCSKLEEAPGQIRNLMECDLVEYFLGVLALADEGKISMEDAAAVVGQFVFFETSSELEQFITAMSELTLPNEVLADDKETLWDDLEADLYGLHLQQLT